MANREISMLHKEQFTGLNPCKGYSGLAIAIVAQSLGCEVVLVAREIGHILDIAERLSPGIEINRSQIVPVALTPEGSVIRKDNDL